MAHVVLSGDNASNPMLRARGQIVCLSQSDCGIQERLADGTKSREKRLRHCLESCGAGRDGRPCRRPTRRVRGAVGGRALSRGPVPCRRGSEPQRLLTFRHPSRSSGTLRGRGSIMNMVSRRQFLHLTGTLAGATLLTSISFSGRASAAAPELVPRKLPFPPNDEFGSYEPTITPDGNTIYFARFAGSGDKRVLGTTTDIFVTHRVRQGGEWPGTGADWTPPERLPDTVNSDSIDQEPRITPDGKTLYFMSRRSGGRGGADIWVTHKQPNGQWSQAQNLGPNVNSEHTDHCFMPIGLPGMDDTSVFLSLRP